MKVRVLVEKEVEADVSLDDVMAEIADLPTPERNSQTLRMLSLCLSAVKKVPDSQIAEMSDAQRAIVVAAIEQELGRYAAHSNREG